jgi:hypothetical protein
MSTIARLIMPVGTGLRGKLSPSGAAPSAEACDKKVDLSLAIAYNQKIRRDGPVSGTSRMGL